MSELEHDDDLRVAALESYRILDTPEDSIFDAITSAIAKLLDVPISLVSLIDDKRQWFKSHYGLETRETPRQFAFCNHAIKRNGLFVVPDASKDERFATNPLVTGDPNIRFYAGMPLFTPDGHGLGTLCAIDRVPRELTEAQQELLGEFAKLVSGALETHQRMSQLANMQEQLGQEQERKELLASMVVHDLRTPLSVITMAASWGSRAAESPDTAAAFSDVLASAGRMQSLLGDVLDICLGEGGMLVPRLASIDIVALLREEILEQHRPAEQKKQSISMTENTPGLHVQVDPMLIRRLLTNLLDNALKYSPKESAILVNLQADDSQVEIAITDQGAKIDASEAEPIFEAHRQGVGAKPGSGYGLGLAFCRLAAEVHGGNVKVEQASGQRGNRFVLTLPLSS